MWRSFVWEEEGALPLLFDETGLVLAIRGLTNNHAGCTSDRLWSFHSLTQSTTGAA